MSAADLMLYSSQSQKVTKKGVRKDTKCLFIKVTMIELANSLLKHVEASTGACTWLILAVLATNAGPSVCPSLLFLF